jgi:hypothetical protein
MDAGGTGGVSEEGGDCGACCNVDQKECGGMCVAIDDPAYGCTPTGCTSCGQQVPNANMVCSNGACVGGCDEGFENCDGNDANGCETNIADDPNNCGACGAVCTVPHATASCNQGMCGIAICDQGWVDCNNDPTDGCETDLNDPMNCGACSNVCPPCSDAGPLCQAGSCLLCPCTEYTAHCPGDPIDVCATKLGTNQDCNFCGDVCALANATSQCVPSTKPPPNFACTLVSCNAGFADCDMNASNGCETDTQNDPAHCGGCGISCGGQACMSGVCAAGGADGGGADGG